jgi:starvation-inducible DNA-binding protein
MHATHNDLSLEVRSQSVAILNAMLADMVDLQRQAKQAHWNVRGPHFISLHKLFDEIAGEFDDIIDDIAERITACPRLLPIQASLPIHCTSRPGTITLQR